MIRRRDNGDHVRSTAQMIIRQAAEEYDAWRTLRGRTPLSADDPVATQWRHQHEQLHRLVRQKQLEEEHGSDQH